MEKKLPDNEKLRYLYYDRNINAEKISKIYKVTPQYVAEVLRKNNIASRKMRTRHIALTTEQIDFINGLLLGDGFLREQKNQQNGRYEHADKRGDYLLWLINQFEEFGIQCSSITNGYYGSYHFYTKNYVELCQIRKLWYPKGKKKIPASIVFSPITLFNFYIGDGSFGRNLYLSKYDLDVKNFISKGLCKLGIDNSIYSDRVHIMKKSQEKFFQYICEIPYFIPKAYSYKFPLEFIQYNRCWALMEKFNRSSNVRP